MHDKSRSLDRDDDGYRSSNEMQVEDGPTEKNLDEDMPPPNRAPPTGPGSQSAGSSKFSFSFKPSSKPTPAAPKLEISQKFNNSAPRREPPQPQDDSRHINNSSTSSGHHNTNNNNNINNNHSRDFPRSAPTEPASARARQDHRFHDQPPQRPRRRVRIVKKMMTRVKPRLQLSEEHAAAESVFYRKPGNEAVIGAGTYGKVFKGQHVYTKEEGALKRIRMEGEKDGFPVTAFREVKLLQALRHENIVELKEVMVEKNNCFMIFEYVAHDLTGLIQHDSLRLKPANWKYLARQMFQGLDYLHTRGVLHRDLKAANILVSRDGVLKLADFGLARFYVKQHRPAYTNRVVTIWYRSPELLLGETRYDGAVDIWSVACIMVEMFLRDPIFPGDGSEINQLHKIYKILGTPRRKDWPGLVNMPWYQLLRTDYKLPRRLQTIYEGKFTPACFNLLEAMLHFDPAQRPTAAQALEHSYFVSEDPPAERPSQ
jgi:CTD kinase subunit alpha